MPAETQSGQTITITLKSSLTSWSQLEQEFKTALNQVPRAIAFNCEALNQVTSSQLGMIWQAHLLGIEGGVPIQLISVPETLARALRVLDLYDILAIEHLNVEISTPNQYEGGVVSGEYNYGDEFRATKEEVGTALKSFFKFLKRFDFPELVTFDLRTIFYEIVTNILAHGQIPSNESIIFSVRVNSSHITMCFSDSGVSFDPTKKERRFDPESIANRRQIKGIGLTLIHRLADSMQYTRKNNSLNVLTIEKSWSI